MEEEGLSETMCLCEHDLRTHDWSYEKEPEPCTYTGCKCTTFVSEVRKDV